MSDERGCAAAGGSRNATTTARSERETCSFHLTTGSVPGREHTRVLRNNQDGVAARVEGAVAVAVVTDGCGSGASSEVGARLGARFLAQALPRMAAELGVGPRLAERATDALLAWMYEVVRPLDLDGMGLAPLIAEGWLFTFLCAVMDADHALIFGVGDGVWSADGVGRVLDAGPDNAPDYLGYRLVPRALLGGGVASPGVPQVHFFGAAHSLAVATDGMSARASELESLLLDAATWKNPAALQRRLNVLATRDRVLGDDATVALLKRGGG